MHCWPMRVLAELFKRVCVAQWILLPLHVKAGCWGVQGCSAGTRDSPAGIRAAATVAAMVLFITHFLWLM